MKETSKHLFEFKGFYSGRCFAVRNNTTCWEPTKKVISQSVKNQTWNQNVIRQKKAKDWRLDKPTMKYN